MQTQTPGSKVHASRPLLCCPIPSYRHHMSPDRLPHSTTSPPRVGAAVSVLNPQDRTQCLTQQSGFS